ncbi:MAG: dTMP kinase [Deinococcus sp.]|nr:dTMP kinase [Deinococcus sp.]
MHGPGYFVSFEGPDGGGKSTQAAKLARFLRREGHLVYLVREPGYTRVGEAIRRIVLSPVYPELEPLTEFLLFAASRAQLTSKVIRPALSEGSIVVADRYADSSVVYQGVGRGLGVDLVRKVNCIATGGLVPDLTILLDVPAVLGLQRVQHRRPQDRLEQLELHETVRQAYLDLAHAEPERFVLVDASPSLEEVAKTVQALVVHRLAGRQNRGR